MHLEVCGKKPLWHTLRSYPGLLPEKNGKITKICQNIRLSDQVLKPWHSVEMVPEYEFGRK
jgi:hypothetical protein